MREVDRAKLFLPFDALKGLQESLRIVEKRKEDKIILSEDLNDELNNKFNSLKIGDNVLIKYYYNLEYIESSGVIKKIDYNNKNIYLMNSIINIDDIVDIISCK